MKCNEITVIKVVLSDDDYFENYQLYKKSCNAKFSDKPLLLDLLYKKNIQDIITINIEEVFTFYKPKSDLEKYLYEFEFNILQSFLVEFLGKKQAISTDTINIIDVNNVDNKIFIEADCIKIENSFTKKEYCHCQKQKKCEERACFNNCTKK